MQIINRLTDITLKKSIKIIARKYFQLFTYKYNFKVNNTSLGQEIINERLRKEKIKKKFGLYKITIEKEIF